jgi:hypothetical protein
VLIVVLDAGTALVAIALVAGARGGWLKSQRLPVDDAYTAWFNAHSRCGEALQAWLDAAPEVRPRAYRTYRVELELEEAAAAELEAHAVALTA